MRTFLVLSLLVLVGCGHATTELDRELALKLVDKAGRIEIVQTGDPIISVHANGGYPKVDATSPDGDDDTRTNCRMAKTWDTNGKFAGFEQHCFGGN